MICVASGTGLSSVGTLDLRLNGSGSEEVGSSVSLSLLEGLVSLMDSFSEVRECDTDKESSFVGTGTSKADIVLPSISSSAIIVSLKEVLWLFEEGGREGAVKKVDRGRRTLFSIVSMINDGLRAHSLHQSNYNVRTQKHRIFCRFESMS